jgi:hypothetical protein
MNRSLIGVVLVAVLVVFVAAAHPTDGGYSLSVGRALRAANGEGQLIYRIDRGTGRARVAIAFSGQNPGSEKGGLFAGRWEEFHEPAK